MDPSSRVSYHAIVARDGRRTVLADPDERTWHAGKSEWRGRKDLNSWSIGAAFEGDTNKRTELGEDEMASMAEYLVPLMRQYGLTLADVTDHRTVAPGRKDDLAWRELERFKAYLSKMLKPPIKEMSLRFEQGKALLKSRNLLRDCLDPQKRPKTVKELRERAYSALRHFPFLDERGEPLWSQDDFEPR
jgi:N-acetyl-anhydromuramoyl-L-alanine amidase